MHPFGDFAEIEVIGRVRLPTVSSSLGLAVKEPLVCTVSKKHWS